jgi:Flp pilus assembly protein TadD
MLTVEMTTENGNFGPINRRGEFRHRGVPVAHQTFAAAPILIVVIILAPPARAQQGPKPFTQDQVMGMVRSGLGDEAGATAIMQGGMDFSPTQDFLRRLKVAGANDVFVEAVRAARQPEPTGGAPKKPLTQVQVFALLTGQVPSRRISMMVQERGIDFERSDDYFHEVKSAGGDDELIAALKEARVIKAAQVAPAAQARQHEIKQHAARGAAFFENRQNTEARAEYREAIRLDPQDSDLHVALSYVLITEEKFEDGIIEARESIRLNPDNDMAHVSLGAGLCLKSDSDRGIEGIAELREAIRLNPKNAMAHADLGAVLGNKGDWVGENAEEREALRLAPNDDFAHFSLGLALEQTHDREGALREFCAAYELNPKNHRYQQAYQRLFQQRNR